MTTNQDPRGTQTERTLTHIFEHGSVSILDQPRLQLTRLSAIIFDIQKLGTPIESYYTEVHSAFQSSWIKVYRLGA